MKIKLNKLSIRNFKGIKFYELQLNGMNANISGDNGTGKTTLYDAFLWCLFGKDSTNKSSFDWKPLDKDGSEIHHLESEVIAELEIDGKVTTLSRITVENWAKKRGSATAEFDEHTTTYSIDGINVKQKDYKAYLDSLIGEETLRMLTQLNYFPEVLDWKTRRQVLIDMAGDVSVEDIIKRNKSLAPLYDLLAERSIDNNLKLVRQQKKAVKGQINDIPHRIDEVDRSLPNIEGLDKKYLQNTKTFIKDDIADKQAERAALQNGTAAAGIKEQIAQLTIHHSELEKEYSNKLESDLDHLSEKRFKLNDELFELKDQLASEERTKVDISNELESTRLKIETLKSQNEGNRMLWNTTKNETFPTFDEHQLNCPTCGQEFTEDKTLEIQANYQKEVEAFNLNKAERLEEIKASGVANNKAIETIDKEIEVLKAEELSAVIIIGELNKRITAKQAEIKEVVEAIERERASLNPFSKTEESADISGQIETLREQLNQDEQSQLSQLDELNKQLDDYQLKLEEANNKLYRLEQYDKQLSRKDELVAEEQQLSLEFGKLESREFLLEEFVKTKVEMITDSINSNFKLVKFKLFDLAINGALIEVCEPTVGGANYSTGLNNAARINAGLDIIQTLMTHYDKKVTVFVDNAESINEILPIDTQLVTLSVSKDEALKVEVSE